MKQLYRFGSQGLLSPTTTTVKTGRTLSTITRNSPSWGLHELGSTSRLAPVPTSAIIRTIPSSSSWFDGHHRHLLLLSKLPPRLKKPPFTMTTTRTRRFSMSAPAENRIEELSMPATSSIKFDSLPSGTTAAHVSVLNGGSINIPLSKMVLLDDKTTTTTTMTANVKREKEERRVDIPVFSFLIENTATSMAVVFDLGIRTDLDGYPPEVIKRFAQFQPKSPKASIGDQLRQGGYNVEGQVDSVVYSHFHWDHCSDIASFPGCTSLVVGPGTLAAALPGYPENPVAHTLTEAFSDAHRTVRELSKKDFNTRVGSFMACDFWEDGSLYLLDAPGHCPGHVAALVRTRVTEENDSGSSSSEFVLLAADASGHRCLFSNYYDEPWKCGLFPGPVVVDQDGKETAPLISMHRDLKTGYDTMAKLRRMDQESECMVILAHDIPFLNVIERDNLWWPEKLNNWRERGWKEEINSSLADP